jgi:hypothetical protein
MGKIFADIDGDGIAEEIDFDLLASTQVRRNGTVLWSSGAYLTGPAGTWNRHPADVFLAADLDGDRASEIVVFNNWDYWTGVLKWVTGAGLQPIWKSGSPLGGPAGSWNRRNDEMSIVGYQGGVAVAVISLGNDWHGILKWQPTPPPGRLELVEITNVGGMTGAVVPKWTYLADLVEVTGTVVPGFELQAMNVKLDSNFVHVVDSVRGSAGMIHCETYPHGIAFGPPTQINRQVSWALPDVDVADPLAGKVWDLATSPPATRDIRAYDHIRVRGRLIIENGHPIQNGIPAVAGGDGWVFLELHPFDYRNVRLVGTPQPSDTVHGDLLVVAPLYDYTTWESTHSSRVWIWQNGGLFHSTSSADIRILAPDPPPQGVDPNSNVFYRETVVHNGTGQSLNAVRRITNIHGGIEVHATVAAAVVQQFGGIGVADVNDPAHDKSILLIEYDVAWHPLSRGLLRHTIRFPNSWQPLGDVNGQIGNPGAVVAVAATCADADDAQFLMATSGGRLWHTIRTVNSWTSVGDVIGQVGYFGPVTAVAATSAAPGEAQFLLATQDGHLWHTIRTANGWTPVGDVNAQVGNPGPVTAVAATSAAPGEAQFLLATQDGHLWHTIRTANGWTPVGDVNAQVGNPGPVTAVAATSAAPGQAQYFFSIR